MATQARETVCVVGAGSMGVVTAHLLVRAGAEVTFLVRPHRLPHLQRPLRLYSYDTLAEERLSEFDVLDDPESLLSTHFDFVVLTLDGSALRSDTGRALAATMGRAFAGTSCVVIVGGVGVELRSWFIHESGLADDQVVSGRLESFAHALPNSSIPLARGVESEALARAHVAYRHYTPDGFCVDLGAGAAARDFAELYNRNGVVRCSLISPEKFSAAVASFASIAAWELLGWPVPEAIEPTSDLWKLGAAAVREIQQLHAFGNGIEPAASSTPEALVAMWRQMEHDAQPLDLTEFFRLHHGGKVRAQDHDILRQALAIGSSEGAQMSALEALVAFLPDDTGHR